MTNRPDKRSEPEPPASVLDFPGATLPLATLLDPSPCGCGTDGRRSSPSAARGVGACCGDKG
jgi:hypothetical protein